MSETIEESISQLFDRAYRNDEFFELKQQILEVQNQESIWKSIENCCYLYEMRTGQKLM